MAKTIQELLADNPSGSAQQIRYVETVEAYNKWAEVGISTTIEGEEEDN